MGDVWLDIGDIWWAILCCQISTQHHLPLAPSLFGYNPKTLTQQQQQISIFTRSSPSRASNILKIDIHLQRGKTKGRLLQDACSGEVSLCRSNVGRISPQPGQPEILPTLIILMTLDTGLERKVFSTWAASCKVTSPPTWWHGTMAFGTIFKLHNLQCLRRREIMAFSFFDAIIVLLAVLLNEIFCQLLDCNVHRLHY